MADKQGEQRQREEVSSDGIKIETRLLPTSNVKNIIPYTASNSSSSNSLSCSKLNLIPSEKAFLLKQFLTVDECKYYISQVSSVGMAHSYNNRTRNNYHVVTVSDQLSAVYWERIKPFIEPITITKQDNQQVGEGLHLEGKWVPVGLNNHWRFSKYEPGGHFGPHYDGSTIESTEERTMKTVNIYLNGGFTGGNTNFLSHLEDLPPEKAHTDDKGRRVAIKENVLFSIVPEAGTALVFNHHILHEGSPLESDEKYIMRTDVIFRREFIPPEIPQKQLKAINCFYEANKLENEGKVKEAGAKISEATRLWPEILFANNSVNI